jgi:DNA invertase Pin-like site-specific DNA recombinase
VKYGYARVSTTDQDLSIQEAALKAAACDMIRTEKVSGTSLNGRPELELLMQFMRPGDQLIVTRIDRLARSTRDLQNIVHDLLAKGVSLKATEQPIDTSTATGKLFLDMLGAFAEFETRLRKERQLEGIARAKAAGVYKGGRPRKSKIDISEIKRLAALGKSQAEIAEDLEISRMSVWRTLNPKT